MDNLVDCKELEIEFKGKPGKVFVREMSQDDFFEILPLITSIQSALSVAREKLVADLSDIKDEDEKKKKIEEGMREPTMKAILSQKDIFKIIPKFIVKIEHEHAKTWSDIQKSVKGFPVSMVLFGYLCNELSFVESGGDEGK